MLAFILLWVFLVILLGPLLFQRIEHNLEFFLLAAGAIAVTASHLLGNEPLLTPHFLKDALLEPVKLAVATLVFGLLFRRFREPITKTVTGIEKSLGPRPFAFLLILAMGLLASVITAIIAALVLCEIVSALDLDKEYETRLVVLTCFSIGMGAVLTPIGEPLSTIAVANLNGDFFMLLRALGRYVLPALVLIALVGSFPRGKEVGRGEGLVEDDAEPFRLIGRRAGKVYVFVVALLLLGRGFKPLIDAHLSRIPAAVLYWANISSAVLDNATLAAAELGPRMSPDQVKGIMMGLLIAGGMLVPGNIPNIIAAGKLKISSRQWAATGIPFGLFLMTLYFVILYR